MRWLQRVALWTIPLAYIGSQAGWVVAEVGRQPWAIQDMLPVGAAISKLQTGSVQLTFFIFLLLFTVLLFAEIGIMLKLSRKGRRESRIETKVSSVLSFNIQFSIFKLEHYGLYIFTKLLVVPGIVTGSLLVFLLFVQGGNSLLFTLGRNDEERALLVNSTGRKWEFTFTTLVTFGGAFFASFPLFYSTSFGGAYWLWMIILFSFVLQAVSYEFQSKLGNLLGKRTYQWFLVINGIVGPLLLGGAVLLSLPAPISWLIKATWAMN